MKPKKTKQNKIKELKEKAKQLCRLGYTTREIGKIVNRSHAWVALAIKKSKKH